MRRIFVHRAQARFQQAVIAGLAYIPLLLNDPGRLAADTKAYLYLDPARLLARAPYMWQPELGLGTVTHQNIGYLWPIGPFFLAGEAAGIPDWVVQRIWLGTILLGAGLGIRWLLRTLGWSGGGVLVGSLAYMLSPYLLNYLDRHSVILLPWAGLPWLIGITHRALRTPGWRHPALFGLVTLTIGGVNASSLLLVGLGPLIWLVWSGLDRSAPWRRVLSTAAKIGVAFLATGLWWMVGLAVQAVHGLPTLRLTENYRVVSDAATAPELFRGLGYWYFYGQGRLGPWVEPATSYTRWALPLSFGLPLLGLLVAAIVRFRHRGHILALMVVGLLVGIGAHPYDAPSPLGRIFREWTLTDSGLALRSTPRVVPLVLLGTAALLAAGVTAISEWRPRVATPATVVLCVLIVANLSPMWRGQLLGALVQRPEGVPAYWHEAASHLDAQSDETRVLEIPGSDFSAYRWGNTGDPLLPGLMDRPYTSRELIPLGSEPSAALVVAFDTEIQEGRFDPNSLAPVAQLMGVGDVVFRADLQYERFRTPRPPDLWDDLRRAPGFADPVSFGDPVPNVAGPERPLLDEHTLARQENTPSPPPAVVLPVLDPVPIVRTADPERPIILAGDATGLVSAAGAGLIQPGRPVLFSATFVDRPDKLQRMAGPNARLIITDSNRKDGHRWGTIRETTGYTERADEAPRTEDLTDHRLNVPGGGSQAQSVAEQLGLRVTASAYGNPVTFTPGDRPYHAVDGTLDTAWTVGAFNQVAGERLILELAEPTQVPHLTVVQAANEGQNRWITNLRVHLDQEIVDVVLREESRQSPGQVIKLPKRSVETIVLEILSTDIGTLDYYAGVTGVGFAEVIVPGVTAEETIRMPTDLSSALGRDQGSELVIVTVRQRSDPLDPIRSSGEEAIDRTFTIPWDRTFELQGQARLSAYAPDDLLDTMLWAGNSTVTASERLPGDHRSRGRSAFDEDSATAWQTRFNGSTGSSVTLTTEQPVDYADLTLTYRSDIRHSAPAVVTVIDDIGPVGTVPIQRRSGGLGAGQITVDLELPEFTSQTLTLRIDDVHPRVTMDWYSGLPSTLPVAVVELGGATSGGPPEVFDSGCRTDVLVLDGNPVPLRVHGTILDAAAGKPLAVEACGDSVSLRLGAGDHRLSATPGRTTGLDLDQLVVSSAPASTPLVNPPPIVRVLAQDRTSYSLEIEHASESFWLILGQSFSEGWRLTGPSGMVSDGQYLVDGYANGWMITPPPGDGPLSLKLNWAPQRWVWMGLGLSGLAALVALWLVLRGEKCQGLSREAIRFSDPRRTPSPVRVRPLQFLVALGLAGFSFGNLPSWPAAAIVIGMGYLLVAWQRLPRSAPGIAALAAMGAASFLIAVDQIRFRYPRDFVWPLFFEQYHVLGVLSVLCLAVAAVVELIERRATPGD
ncbi:MAG: alpha-(1-_3)-arabinofuranosyltransferase family protein [Actinomycetota bacterium]|nr:alpha-(1->3)-arabinofuranosyltransferase family protein [Actinomycetota bacterium]